MAASTRTVQVVTKFDGTITNASAAILRSAGFKVKNESPAKQVADIVTASGKTPNVVSFWSLTPKQQSQLHARAKAARAKVAAKSAKAKAKG